ncbi:LysR family transcriptional regulator [Bosea massiliensis]|jgi:DNA-binding transcriptional LysR family regulator|uniref:LysR family transcriptional regulator n=1 Tax=Bosea massiliensis TaxID=151419 RepID=A0ABW0P9Y9_9HYPH
MPFLPLAKIQTFLALAETLNFRRTAERLGVAQPSLSRSIAQLEDQLGFRLLERSTRRVSLTEAGEALHREGEIAISSLARACEHAKRIASGAAGKITVGYTTFAANGSMSDIIIEFRTRYPDIEVNLRLMASPEQWEGFTNRSLDFGFILSNACNPPLAAVAVSSERMILVAPLRHPWSGRKSVTLREVTQTRVVAGTAQRWKGFRPLLDTLFARRNLTLHVSEEADDLPVLLQLVRSGFGCTILDASFISTLPSGVQTFEIEDADVRVDVSLAWREDNLSVAAKRFLEVARAYGCAKPIR